MASLDKIWDICDKCGKEIHDDIFCNCDSKNRTKNIDWELGIIELKLKEKRNESKYRDRQNSAGIIESSRGNDSGKKRFY